MVDCNISMLLVCLNSNNALWAISKHFAPQFKASTIRIALSVLQGLGAVEAQGSNKETIDFKELKQLSSVNTWLDELKEGQGCNSALYSFKRFWDYVKERPSNKFSSPDDLITNALDGTPRNLLLHLQIIKEYLKTPSFKHVDESTKRRHYASIRGFYKRNGVTLPVSRVRSSADDENRQIKKNNGNNAQKMFTALRKMLTIASARDRAILLYQLQGGLDESTLASAFNYMAYSQISEQLGKDWREWDPAKGPVRIQLFRPKTGKEYYTFIAEDAIVALKDWLKVRFNQTKKEIEIEKNNKQSNVARSDPIFITQAGKRIANTLPGDVFRNLSFKSGVNERVADTSQIASHRGSTVRYDLHGHEVRDTMKSLAHSIGINDEVEYFLGHEIDKLGYDKSPDQYPDYWRDLYRKLVPFLNIVSNDPAIVSTQEELKQVKESKDFLATNLATQNRMLEAEMREMKTKQLEDRMTINGLLDKLSQLLDSDSRKEEKSYLRR